MKIVVAPDKFKGSLSAAEAAEAIAAGIQSVDPQIEIDICPMADGGQGTVAALVAATGGRTLTRRVTGPLPEMKVDATYGILGDGVTTVIEMSAACGLALLSPQDRNPLNTTTFGAGELIRTAIENGCRKIILGIGDSATIDAGVGCAQACGFTILMRDGEPTAMSEPLCGRDLDNILTIKHGRGEITNGIDITVACDVTNPLFGPNGAARIFGPQKGATPEMIEQLERALESLAQRTGKLAEANQPGAGAAGGMGFGLTAFFNAKLRRGVELIADANHLSDRLKDADLCFTGEGQFDAQSLRGKTTLGVARLCKAPNVRCIVLAGSVRLEAERAVPQGVTAIHSLSSGLISTQQAIEQAGPLLQNLAAQCTRQAMKKNLV